MQSSSLRALAGAAAISTLAVGGAAFTSGSSAEGLAGQSRILHLVEKGGDLRFVDNPPRAKHSYDFSAGDIVIVSRDLYTRKGAGAGSLRIVCVVKDQTTQQCNGTETLSGGTLEVAGVSSPAPSTTVAVIGGTGAYNGARGTSKSRDRKTNSNIADQTITLQP